MAAQIDHEEPTKLERLERNDPNITHFLHYPDRHHGAMIEEGDEHRLGRALRSDTHVKVLELSGMDFIIEDSFRYFFEHNNTAPVARWSTQAASGLALRASTRSPSLRKLTVVMGENTVRPSRNRSVKQSR
jgi:hypothetical protein